MLHPSTYHGFIYTRCGAVYWYFMCTTPVRITAVVIPVVELYTSISRAPPQYVSRLHLHPLWSCILVFHVHHPSTYHGCSYTRCGAVYWYFMCSTPVRITASATPVVELYTSISRAPPQYVSRLHLHPLWSCILVFHVHHPCTYHGCSYTRCGAVYWYFMCSTPVRITAVVAPVVELYTSISRAPPLYVSRL